MPVLDHSIRLVNHQESYTSDTRSKFIVLSIPFRQPLPTHLRRRATYGPDEVPQTPRRSDKHIATPLDDPFLLLRAQTANDIADTDPWRTLRLSLPIAVVIYIGEGVSKDMVEVIHHL